MILMLSLWKTISKCRLPERRPKKKKRLKNYKPVLPGKTIQLKTKRKCWLNIATLITSTLEPMLMLRTQPKIGWLLKSLKSKMLLCKSTLMDGHKSGTW